jgi:hypothetical protein
MQYLKLIDRGHENLLEVLKGLPQQAADSGLVTGTWNIKDIVNHLAVYEQLQYEAVKKVIDRETPTSLLDQKNKSGIHEFNKRQWEKDKDKSWPEVLQRYLDSFAKLRDAINSLPPELVARPNTTHWYGNDCGLDDVIAYNYGHKKHHIAQIKLFRTPMP